MRSAADENSAAEQNTSTGSFMIRPLSRNPGHPIRWLLARTRTTGAASSPLLSRVEAHFHLGIHFDRVAALDHGLIPELRPRHRLAELRAAVELRNLAVLADDDFAVSRSARR